MRHIPHLLLLRVLAAGLVVAVLEPLGPHVPVVSELLLPTAHALDTHEDHLNECWFDGHGHTRNLGAVDYRPVSVTLETLHNPPHGFGPRPTKVTGLIMPGLTVGHREATPQPSSGFHTGGEGDVDPGHVFALHLGGPDDARNIVPQWSQWQQRGKWREMEQRLDQEARKVADESRPPGGGPPTRAISYDIELTYRDTGTTTPSLVAWSFPKAFYVSACVVELNDRQRQCIRIVLENEKFEGGPPHD